MAGGLDENVAKVHIQLFMPLFLQRRSHTFRVEHGVIIPQSSRCLIFWMCMSRNHANGETAVLVRALEAVVKPELAAAGRCLKRLPLSDSS